MYGDKYGRIALEPKNPHVSRYQKVLFDSDMFDLVKKLRYLQIKSREVAREVYRVEPQTKTMGAIWSLCEKLKPILIDYFGPFFVFKDPVLVFVRPIVVIWGSIHPKCLRNPLIIGSFRVIALNVVRSGPRRLLLSYRGGHPVAAVII